MIIENNVFCIPHVQYVIYDFLICSLPVAINFTFQAKPWVFDRFGRACVRRNDDPNVHVKLSFYTLTK